MTTAIAPSPRPDLAPQPRNCVEENLLEQNVEAEICHRFVRLSCDKMLASRNSRGGARLHRNLLILHLLRKARNNTKMMPYECSDLLKRHPVSSLLPVAQRIISAANSRNLESESAPLQTNEEEAASATFIVFDTNDDSDDCESAQNDQREEEGLFPLRRHGNTQQLFEGDVELSEEEELSADKAVKSDEPRHISEELCHPMGDVNMKIDCHIDAQLPSEEEEIDVVGINDELHTPKPLPTPIGSHLAVNRQSTLFGGAALMSSGLAKEDNNNNEEEEEEDVYHTVHFPERTHWRSNSSSESSFFSSSNTMNVSISYQYETKEEPLEYTVHDREESRPQRQPYRQGHADYSPLDFPSCRIEKDDQEEFERQQRRHFSGRLYERCNFTRFQQSHSSGAEQLQHRSSSSSSSSRHRFSNSFFSSSSNRTNTAQQDYKAFASDRSSFSSSLSSRVHRSSAWRSLTKRDDDDQTEAIEEGTDIAAEMAADPPKPLRSPSDWLRRQFSHSSSVLSSLHTPTLSSILVTPLSPPFVKPSEAQRIPFPSGFHHFEDEEHNGEEDGSNGEDAESPPRVFHCSPPNDGVLVFECSEDEDEEEEKGDHEKEPAEDDEEGFFEEEEDDCDDDGEECDGQPAKTMRKRKTTGTGAGRLAVLEKRPCCNEEDASCANKASCSKAKHNADSDSGVDVALCDVFCEDSAAPPADSKPLRDQTVPVAIYL